MVQVSHHVFMNLHNGKIYCLPGAKYRGGSSGSSSSSRKKPRYGSLLDTAARTAHTDSVGTHLLLLLLLSDLYEVVDSSLDDIKRALFPSFTKADIARLNSNKTLIRDVHGVTYLPGEAKY